MRGSDAQGQYRRDLVGMMGLRVKFSLAIRRFMLVAPIVALALNAATFSLVGADYLTDLGVAARVAAPALFTLAIFAAMTGSWAWVHILKMNVADREAVRELDPYQRDRLTPKEAAVLLLWLDYMEGNVSAYDVAQVAEQRQLHGR